jgi:hypothetical protein
MIIKEVPQNNTFIVRVENRQNGTWQGKIIWADEDRTEHFRSVLEMLWLMEEAMAGGAQAAYDLLEQQSV